ncbi:MAG: hypothetical protein ACLU0O_06345 [Collinsella sp.]
MASVYEVCGLAIDRIEALFGVGGALDLPGCPSSPPTTTSRRSSPCSS